MKKRTVKILVVMITAITLAALFPVYAEEQCDHTAYLIGASDADREFWSYLQNRGYSMFELRNDIASYYNLEEDDWDGGWGYKKWDEEQAYYWEFPRIMTAGTLLWFGIDDRLTEQGPWISQSAGTSVSDPVAVVRNADTIDTIGIDQNDHLYHYRLSAEDQQWPPGELAPNASGVALDVRDGKNRPIRFQGQPAMISRSADSLDIFAQNGYHLHYITWSQTSGWSTDNTSVTQNIVRSEPSSDPFCQYRYCISNDPVVIQHGESSLHVFALDEYDHVIHFYLNQGEAWQAEDVTYLSGALSSSGEYNFAGKLQVIEADFGIFLIFIRNTHGKLIEFRGDLNNGWSVSNITRSTDSALSVDSDPAVVMRGSEAIHLFFRGGGAYHLIQYSRSSASPWRVKDLTSELNADPIEGQPFAIVRNGRLSVFTRGGSLTGNHLLHYSWSLESNWRFEDLTQICPQGYGCSDSHSNPKFGADPVAVSTTGRIDVYGRSPNSYLTHYYWTPANGWLAEIVSYSNSGSVFYGLLDSDPLIVYRSEATRDVIGRRVTGYSLYTAAIGIGLNSWHTNEEYSNWAAGSQHQFKYVPGKEGEEANVAAVANWGVFDYDQVRIFCHGFEQVLAIRAGIMAHEATHMNFHVDHENNPSFPDDSEENCGSVKCWDTWIEPHLPRDPGGILTGGVPASGSSYDIDPNHHAYQVEIEYLCDLGEHLKDNLPRIFVDGMVEHANHTMDEHILNPPGWRCGIPRPLD